MLRYAGIAALFFLCTSATAQDLSYSYVQGGYERVDLDVGGSVDGDGFNFGGAVQVAENWHILANYSSTDFDFGIDFSQATIGAGYHNPISRNTDWFGELFFVRAEADGFGASADDSGIGARLGLRSMISPDFELFGAISHIDLDDGVSGTGIGGGFWYTLSGNLAVGLSASFDDDATAYGLGLRLYFDR